MRHGKLLWPLVAALILAAGQTVAQEKSRHTGDTLGLRLILGYAGVDDVTLTGSGTLSEKSSDQELLGLAISMGYDWSKKGLPFRSELEYTYRPRFDFDVRVNGGTDSDFEDNVSSHMFMANVFYDIRTKTRYTPYIGAGIGWVRNNSDSEQTKLLGGAKQSRENSEDELAWSVYLGTLFRLGPNLELDFAYRYADLGSIKSGSFSDGAVVAAGDYAVHDFILGVLYRF